MRLAGAAADDVGSGILESGLPGGFGVLFQTASVFLYRYKEGASAVRGRVTLLLAIDAEELGLVFGIFGYGAGVCFPVFGVASPAFEVEVTVRARVVDSLAVCAKEDSWFGEGFPFDLLVKDVMGVSKGFYFPVGSELDVEVVDSHSCVIKRDFSHL